MLPLQRAWVGTLVRVLRSHMPHGIAKKKRVLPGREEVVLMPHQGYLAGGQGEGLSPCPIVTLSAEGDSEGMQMMVHDNSFCFFCAFFLRQRWAKFL